MDRRLALTAATLAVSSMLAAPALADRAVGMDISDWQGNSINYVTAAKPVAQGGGGISFAFIRSSRGGTTGTYNESTKVGTLSERYDDLYFANNMAKAKAAGVLAGAYHFSRPDILTNTGTDEANHFLEKAGAYMRPGYIRPVLDLEAGSARNTASNKKPLTDFAVAFSDRIFEVTGVRPIVYCGANYAKELEARFNTHDLWLARWVDPTVTDVQTTVHPPLSSNVYGIWNPTYPTMPALGPWDFWQYAAEGAIPGVGGTIDHDIANGDIEFVKDFLVPAMWTPAADGQWTTAANWNGVTVTPTALDRVIVDKPGAVYTITLSGGTNSIRSLQMNESFKLTAGSLAVAQYANLGTSTVISGGTLTSVSIANGSPYTQFGGTVTTGAITGTGFMTVSGGTLRATSIRQSLLAIDDGVVELLGTGTSVVGDLTADGVGHLDIGAAKLVVDYPVGGLSPLDTLRQSLANGAILTTAGDTRTGVAYFLPADLFTALPGSFGGVSVDASSVLLTSALRGDTNLSGTVNFDDLIKIAQNYNTQGRWAQGDFTYDGVVNFDDLIALAQNYGAGAGAVTIGDAAFASDWALAQSLVPEPTSLFLALAASRPSEGAPRI